MQLNYFLRHAYCIIDDRTDATTGRVAHIYRNLEWVGGGYRTPAHRIFHVMLEGSAGDVTIQEVDGIEAARAVFELHMTGYSH